MRGRRQAFLLIAWHEPVPHACVPKAQGPHGGGGQLGLRWRRGSGEVRLEEDLERVG